MQHPSEVLLTQELIRCPSITPFEGGALTLLAEKLQKMGFTIQMMPFAEDGTADVMNLWAKYQKSSSISDKSTKHLCFAGHTDVVPAGATEKWTYNPFEAVIKDGVLYGRGASDMKSAIAAFVIATEEYLLKYPDFNGAISFMITGDEEGPSVNGTKKMVQTLKAQGEHISHCIVGEPTNPDILGTMMKVGRRGSMNVDITVFGVQGHVAYPYRADNPIPKLVTLLNYLTGLTLDEGNLYFQPSNLELTNIEINNSTDNVIPEIAKARFNIRFNSEWTSKTLQSFLKQHLDDVASLHSIRYELGFRVSGESFLTHDKEFFTLLHDSVAEVTGLYPDFSTTGGTSDARFIKDLCPVVEFGSVGATMHQINESVTIEDIITLKKIYGVFLEKYFGE